MEVYLDNHSSTKIDRRVFEKMLPYFETYYANAQSMHALGTKSKDALEEARFYVAELINAKKDEIYFTSCGSEANNLAIKGIADAYKNKGKHIIVSSVEHFSILHSVKRLEKIGYEVAYLPVDKYGIVSPEDVKKQVREDTILVSIQYANSEIGTIQLISEISKVVKEKNILFHTDAVSCAGKTKIDVNELGADLLTLSSSPMYGPKGAAALYIKKGVRIIPQIDGGIQENGYRAGEENIPALVGFGYACKIAKDEQNENYKKVILLRDKLISEIQKKIEYVHLNGHPELRLPDNVNFSVEFVEGESMILLLNEKGIYTTSGSACTSRALKMSHVLSATKIDPAIAQGSLLMTLSKYNTEEEIDYVIYELPQIVKKLREMSPLYAHFLKTGERRYMKTV